MGAGRARARRAPRVGARRVDAPRAQRPQQLAAIAAAAAAAAVVVGCFLFCFLV